MAAKRSPEELAETSGFITMLYEVGGYARWAEFARDAGVHSVSLSGWKNAESCPDGYNLLRLLQAAVRRAGGTLENLAERRGEEAPPYGVAELDRRLEEVADLAAENFEILRGQLDDVARRLPPEADQGHRAGGSR